MTPTDRELEGLTREQKALLAACDIVWSETFGCWLDESDTPTTRFDSTADALDEACARVEIERGLP